MLAQTEGAGLSRLLVNARPVVSDEQMLENVKSALSRNLPPVGACKAHNRVMSIAAGGPSLEDTLSSLVGDIVTANAGLSYLLDRDIYPWACGLLDARPHIADLIEPRRDVFFFVSSTCHPSVFDKLEGCPVGIWHPSGMPGIEEVLPRGTDMIGGGTTMGLRWFNIGYYMGFRRFDGHGLDSSFRGTNTHAYPDRRDGRIPDLIVDGFATSVNFLQQVKDFGELVEMFAKLDDPPTINLRGDGLLQRTHAEHRLRQPR